MKLQDTAGLQESRRDVSSRGKAWLAACLRVQLDSRVVAADPHHDAAGLDNGDACTWSFQAFFFTRVMIHGGVALEMYQAMSAYDALSV